jgi:GntR family transcriptional regulator / MocR family aminotransferase
MLLNLDGDGPMYQQLSRAIHVAVRLGRIAPGARLPSTRDMAQELRVSRNTIRAAYDQLTTEGVLASQHGSGSFVATVLPGRIATAKSMRGSAPSRFSQRVRDVGAFDVGVMHRGLRFNLQYGEPLTDPLLPDVWRRELTRSAAYTSLGYPNSQGLPELRTEVASYLKRRRGIDVSADDLLIVAGTQQALSLAARVLLDEGASAVIEDPGYFAARWALQAHGAQVLPVPVDRYGINVDELPLHRPGLIYVTPAHQFPLGMALAPRRRAELLKYARKLETWIVEDDYDGEVSFDAPQLPALYGADSADRVVHIGSFSKVLAPSIRLAYLVPPKALRDDFLAAKFLADFGCSAYEQAALAHFLRSGGFQRHLRRVVQSLRQRRDALVDGLHEHAGGHFSFDVPRSGMHLAAWLVSRSQLDLVQLVRVAAAAGVGVHPLERHYMSAPPLAKGLLLGYAGLSTAEITMACQLLGSCIAKLQKDRALNE